MATCDSGLFRDEDVMVLSCPECSYVTTKQSSLMTHVMGHSKGILEFLQCEICKKVATSRQFIEEHTQSDHKNAKKPAIKMLKVVTLSDKSLTPPGERNSSAPTSAGRARGGGGYFGGHPSGGQYAGNAAGGAGYQGMGRGRGGYQGGMGRGGYNSSGSHLVDTASYKYSCEFCTFRARRQDELQSHYREKHDFLIKAAASASNDFYGGGDMMGANASMVKLRSHAPIRQSLLFSPSNYIFISNPGEYLIDLTDDDVEGLLKYHPGYLQKKDADALLRLLKKELPWEKLSAFNKRKNRQTFEPRLSCYTGPDYEYGPVQWRGKTEWHPKLLELKSTVEKVAGRDFNSVLGVLYRNGRDHMGWHSDDEPELGKNPGIVSVSLGTTRYFEFSRKGHNPKIVRLALKHGDVLISEGCVQERWKHWVPPDPDVQHCRINLTFRHVDPSLRPHKPENESATGSGVVAVPSNSAEGKVVVLEDKSPDEEVEMKAKLPAPIGTPAAGIQSGGPIGIGETPGDSGIVMDSSPGMQQQ